MVSDLEHFEHSKSTGKITSIVKTGVSEANFSYKTSKLFYLAYTPQLTVIKFQVLT